MSVRQHYQHENVQGIKVGRVDRGINTQFIVYRLGDTVIDAGPSNQWRHVRTFLQQQPLRQLLLTHHHEDHSGNACSIGKHFKLIPKAPALAQAKLASGYATPLLQKLIWGSLKPVQTQTLAECEYLADGSEIVPVHTPGHAKDLTCFHLPQQGYFFSGDLYIAKTIKMMRSDEDMPQLVASLKKVLALDFDTLFCPHGGIIQQGKQSLQLKLNNILELCARVQEFERQGWHTMQISHELLGPKDFIGKITGGNFSKMNLISQCARVDL